MGGERMDYCECCGKVEVFDGKVCRECEEIITRNLAAAFQQNAGRDNQCLNG